MGASHLSRAVYSPFNNIITIKSLVRRRAGVPILSFEDGADSAKRSPRSASVCTQYEHFAHLLRSVQNAKWQRIEETGFQSADSVSPERVIHSYREQQGCERKFCLFLKSEQLVFDRFRGAGNLAEQEGVLHLGLNNVALVEQLALRANIISPQFLIPHSSFLTLFLYYKYKRKHYILFNIEFN